MGGKAIVNGEQNDYSGKWTYDINKLDAWIIYTREKNLVHIHYVLLQRL